jgi:hypothetical protein
MTKSEPRARRAAVASTREEGFPAGLTLLLALLAGFGVIVGYVVYLAGQMP